MTVRRGVTLVELLIALVLSAGVAAAALTVLRQQLREVGQLVAHRVAEDAVIDSWSLLRADLGSVIPVVNADIGIVAGSDSTIELWALRGMAVVCDTSGSDDIVIVAPAASDARAASWSASPRTGDRLIARVAPRFDSPDTDRWDHSDLVSVRGASRCPSAPGAPSISGLRWRVAGIRPAIGALLRIARRTQHRLYRSADGAWAIGVREWNGVAWSTTQPAVAPLAARIGPTAGIRLSAQHPSGAPLPWPGSAGDTLGIVVATIRGGNTAGVPLDSALIALPAGRP
jgi:prepilin-type N-terminal cleavage/methylation domain-containing protein